MEGYLFNAIVGSVQNHTIIYNIYLQLTLAFLVFLPIYFVSGLVANIRLSMEASLLLAKCI